MVDGAGAARVLDLDVRCGWLDDLRGATVALDAARPQAAHSRSAIGPVALGDGTPVRLTVVATYERALGFGRSCSRASSPRRTPPTHSPRPC